MVRFSYVSIGQKLRGPIGLSNGRTFLVGDFLIGTFLMAPTIVPNLTLPYWRLMVFVVTIFFNFSLLGLT